MLPGIADKHNLLPMYDRVYEKIRKIDTETIVMYEPVTWGLMSNKSDWGTGFDHPPGNDSYGTSLAWHYYCWIINVDPDPIRNESLPDYIRGICDEWQLPLYFETVRNDVIRLGGGASFITEFGTCNFNDPVTGKLNLEQCSIVMDGADKYFVPWTYWDSDFYSDDFKIVTDYIDIFARVYPIATNGYPISFLYNSTTRLFAYSFELNVSSREQASLNTEIFVPMYLYPKGFEVTVTSNLKWSFDKDSSRVLVSLNDSILNNFEQIEYLEFSTVSSVVIKSK